jgi:hypothetical protein
MRATGAAASRAFSDCDAACRNRGSPFDVPVEPRRTPGRERPNTRHFEADDFAPSDPTGELREAEERLREPIAVHA